MSFYMKLLCPKTIQVLKGLESAFAEKDMPRLLDNLKLLNPSKDGELIAFPMLAKVAEILTTEEPFIEDCVRIICLKYLCNACLFGYMHKEYDLKDIEAGTYHCKLYSILANAEHTLDTPWLIPYPFDSHFPYEGVIEWTSSFIKLHHAQNEITPNTSDIWRMSVQVLCNLFTFACKDYDPSSNNVPQYLYDVHVKHAIINRIDSSDTRLATVSCMFLHNCLKKYKGDTFVEEEKKLLCLKLIEATYKRLECAIDALLVLMCLPNGLPNVYDDMTGLNKVHLLEIISAEFAISTDEPTKYVLPRNTIEFLTERFCERSDLILKTAEPNLDEKDAREIVALLDIIATLTSGSYKEYNALRCYKSLLLNCTYLLKSIHTIGKESNNCFTPLQNLASVTAMMRSEGNDIQNHPAFAFKARLIRIIGNIVYRNKELQDLLHEQGMEIRAASEGLIQLIRDWAIEVATQSYRSSIEYLLVDFTWKRGCLPVELQEKVREVDAIPLLLDCCNIDARNPFIPQWTILALRHLCEDNRANQEIIRNCNRVGVVTGDLLKEMGSITLDEDQQGRKIAVVPLPTERK